MIPKIIHYCWFGGNPKTELINKCIQSWKQYMPDYEIMEWNEKNFDVNQCSFSADAYNVKKWAFVSDYARFKVLEQYGGVYFDTDVELLKPIPEEILSKNAFSGVESSSNLISPGLVFGCIPQYSIVKELVNEYEKALFDVDNPKIVNRFTTEVLQKKGYVVNGEYQIVGDMAIYDADVFCGYDIDINEVKITERTISVHHYASSWMNIGLKRKIQNLIKKVFGINAYRRLLMLKRRLK